MAIQYSEHPSMFKNNPILFVLAVVSILAFGIGLIILLVWYLKVLSTKLTITDSEIQFERGLLSKERLELGMSSVRTVKVNQSFFDRMFGVGSIAIYSAGDSPEITASGMPDPDRIRALIKD